MREKERKLMRERLDVEMRPYRRAGVEQNPTNGLLRAVRQALHIPVAEVAEKMGVNRSGVFDLEAREPENTISLKSMSRMAEAMGCKVVYGIVPKGGKTLEKLAEERLWTSVLVKGRNSEKLADLLTEKALAGDLVSVKVLVGLAEGKGNREQGTGNREQGIRNRE
jgi:predicted DNA-binding mobile mystery protein A